MITARLSLILPLACLTICSAHASDLYWDGGTTNIAANGDGVSSFLAGTWSAAVRNWDQGEGLAHVSWNTNISVQYGPDLGNPTPWTNVEIGPSGGLTYTVDPQGAAPDLIPSQFLRPAILRSSLAWW